VKELNRVVEYFKTKGKILETENDILLRERAGGRESPFATEKTAEIARLVDGRGGGGGEVAGGGCDDAF
jgi:hypothetical protein